MEVTVGNVTVVITDYQPKKPSDASNNKHLQLSPAASNTKESAIKSTSDDAVKSSKNETVVNGEAATMDES